MSRPPANWPEEREGAYSRARALGEVLALPAVIVVWIVVIVGGARILAGMA